MLNLDTHILLNAITGEITPKERGLLGTQEWSISGIVLWEIAQLAERGRIRIDLDDGVLTRLISGLHVWPITIDICRAIRMLDFESDPADELIAATSIAHRIPLLTRDARIRKSKIVPLASV